MDQLDILIGKELKSLRISNKKSMQTVADHAGKAKSVIFYYESGKVSVSIPIKWFICIRYGKRYTKPLYYTGMRPAEALALTRKDIQNDRIIISKALGSDLNKETVIVPTKTKQSSKVIPVAPKLKPILKDLERFNSYDYLFCNYDGSLCSINKLSSYVFNRSKNYGIKFNLYMLRHRFATDLIKEGTNSIVVQDLMGHANFSMSVEYARSSGEDLVNAIKNR